MRLLERAAQSLDRDVGVPLRGRQIRVTEQLLTLITPSEWMDGKILGITLHCLKSMATVIIIMLLVTVLMSVIKGGAFNLPPVGAQAVIVSVVFVWLL